MREKNLKIYTTKSKAKGNNASMIDFEDSLKLIDTSKSMNVDSAIINDHFPYVQQLLEIVI